MSDATPDPFARLTTIKSKKIQSIRPSISYFTAIHGECADENASTVRMLEKPKQKVLILN